jgi:hypothetical protein
MTQLKIRVMPHFPVEPSMLNTDGSTLNDATMATYMTFLADQISDLIAYFTSRNIRSTGMVDLTGLDEDSNDPTQPLTQQMAMGNIPLQAPLKTPPMPQLNLSMASSSSQVMDPPARPPVSGVGVLGHSIMC